MISCNCIFAIINLTRPTVGPLDLDPIFWIWLLTLRIYQFYFLVCGIEIFAVKYMSIVVLKRVLHVMDNFWNVYLVMANSAISFMLSLINCFSTEASEQYLLLNKGFHRFLGHETFDSSPFRNILLLFFLIFVSYVSLKIHKEKKKHKPST